MNHRNRRPWVLRLLLPVLIILPAVFLTLSHARAAIELIYFLAETESTRIRLEWETATELDNSGFYIRRSLTGGNNPDDYTRITVSGQSSPYIPPQGDDLAGALYIYYDEDVTIGTRYYYFLEDIDDENISSFNGPYEVVAGQTPTPTLSASDTPTVPPSSTSAPPTSTSANPTATPSRTPTSSGSGVQPTATGSPAPGTPSTTPQAVTSTDTPTPDPSIAPIDLTLTAISSALTELPTASPTTASTEVAALAPSPTSTSARTATVEPTQNSVDAEGPPIGRIGLVVFVFLVSGGLLTAGIFYFVRQSSEA